MSDDQCRYCKRNPKPLLAGKGEYISAMVKIFFNEDEVRLGYNANGETNIKGSIRIQYCPVCGKKLVP